MKKVLIIDEQFPNTGGTRTEKFVKYLSKFGWQPIILTIDQREKNPFFQFIIDSYETRKFKLYNTKTFPSFSFLNRFKLERMAGILNSFFFIPDLNVAWLPFAVNMGCRIIEKENPHIIYSTSPSEGVHLIAYSLKKKMGLPWVADFRDLWTLYKKRYKPPTAFHHLINRFIEREIYCRWSDAVVANTKENKDIIVNEFKVESAKVNIITNGYDPDDIPILSDKNIAPREDKLILGYMGGLEKAAICYKEFLSAFAIAIKKESNFSLQLWAMISKKLNRDIFKNPIIKDHVVVNPYLPHQKCIEALRKVDLLVVLLSSGYEHVVPQKLFNYLCLRKPILGVVPSEGRAAKIIRNCNIGIVVDPNNVDGIAKSLLEHYERWRKKSIQPIKDSQTLKKYQRDNLTLKLANLFERTLGTEIL